SGASNYYSAVPTAEGNWQDYVPDAHDFPYVQTEYTPDNTGRIRRQSGVGADYTIDGDHATEYYYVQARQEELNRLFGYQVGYNSRYKKNMVVDANGQVSISYIDPQGRVIATSLAGTNVTGGSGVDPVLLSVGEELTGNHGQLVVDLLNKVGDDDPDTDIDDNEAFSTGAFGSLMDAKSLNTQILSTDNGNAHDFTYRIRTSSFSDECMAAGKAYPFAYDLFIDVKDDCGNSVIDAPDATINETVVGTHGAGYTSTTDVDATYTFTTTLATGSYSVTKIVKVNEEKLEEYVDDYIENNECLLSYEDFLTETDKDCPDGDAPGGIDKCFVSLEMMKMDVSPGGQYGALSGDGWEISVFNTGTNYLAQGASSTTLNYENPLSGDDYKDMDGTSSTVTIGGVAYDPKDLSLDDFVDNWQPSWADVLVKFHPEYEYLALYDELCSSVKTGETYTSTEYDDAILAIDNYADAISTSNAIGVDLTTSGATANLFNLYAEDPFFSNTYSFVSDNALKSNLMEEIIEDYKANADNYDLWEIALYTVGCGTDLDGSCTPPVIGSLTTEEKDQVWNTYKNYYISEKKKVIQLFMDINAIENGFYNGYIGGSATTPPITAFTYYTTFSSVMDEYIGAITAGTGTGAPYPSPWFITSSGAEIHHFSTKVQRFMPISNLYDSGLPEDDAIDALVADGDAAIYESTGKCPLLLDAEAYLNALAANDKLIGSGLSTDDYPEFTSDLFVGMGGTLGLTSTITLNNTNVSSQANIGGTQGVTSLTTIKLDAPSDVTLTWAN
ncbi:MAG: hypothetical protein MK078_05990, partial [Crocinitomicaceae bacterium]|nr:hypothetical protein [Crocinitomicaceae bacterium]